MGTLREQMTEAMKLRRFSPRTQQSYLAAVTALANYYHTAPDQLDFEKIKAYLLYLTVERALSWSTCMKKPAAAPTSRAVPPAGT